MSNVTTLTTVINKPTMSENQLNRLRQLVKDCETGKVRAIAWAAECDDGMSSTRIILPDGAKQVCMLGALAFLQSEMTNIIREDT